MIVNVGTKVVAKTTLPPWCIEGDVYVVVQEQYDNRNFRCRNTRTGQVETWGSHRMRPFGPPKGHNLFGQEVY